MATTTLDQTPSACSGGDSEDDEPAPEPVDAIEGADPSPIAEMLGDDARRLRDIADGSARARFEPRPIW